MPWALRSHTFLSSRLAPSRAAAPGIRRRAAAPKMSAQPAAAGIVEFLMIVQNLKTTPRTGWVRSGVQRPESVADHMYRMAVLAVTVAGGEYDQPRLVKMAIVHDLAEALVGDIAPSDGVPEGEKHAREAAALDEMLKSLGKESAAAHEMRELWWEYERGETKEAQLCKDFDKLEMILQAHEYERAQGLSLQDFFDSTADKWRTELGCDR